MCDAFVLRRATTGRPYKIEMKSVRKIKIKSARKIEMKSVRKIEMNLARKIGIKSVHKVHKIKVESVRKIGWNRCMGLCLNHSKIRSFLRPTRLVRVGATSGRPLFIHCTDKTKTAFPHIHLPFRKRPFAERTLSLTLSKGFGDSKDPFPKGSLAGFGAAPRVTPRVPAYPHISTKE